jgi:hypothetical protein
MKSKKSFPNRHCPKGNRHYWVAHYGSGIDEIIIQLLVVFNGRVKHFQIDWYKDVEKPTLEDISTWKFVKYPNLKKELDIDEFELLRKKYFEDGELGFENDFYYIESLDKRWSMLVEKWDLEFVLITFDDSKKKSFKAFESKFSSDLISFFSSVYLRPEIRSNFLEAVALNFK